MALTQLLKYLHCNLWICSPLKCPLLVRTLVSYKDNASYCHDYREGKNWTYFLLNFISVQFSSVTQSCPTLCGRMNRSTPGLPSPTAGVHSNSRPLSQWCHPAISSSVIHFSSCHQSLPASESFPGSQPFLWGGQSIGVSALASVLPMNTQDWSPLGRTGWISLQSKDSQESSPTTQFKNINSLVLSLLHSPTLTSIHDHRKNHSLD